MDKEQKYKLVDATEEEKSDFMKKFNSILTETSMYFEPVPQFMRENIQEPWRVVCQVILQKKVEIKKKEVISPIQDVTPTETA